MTTQEKRCIDALMPRAEEIMRIVKKHCEDCDYSHYDPTEEVAAEIQKIIDEAWGKDDRDHFDKVRKRAAELAYEDAAKIAEAYQKNHARQTCIANIEIADSIRARAKEAK